MADNIPGTNIPKSSIKAGNKHSWQEWAEILADSDDKNDVLFDIAYWNTPGGKGQGNPDVGAVQSNIWSLTGDHKTWAEEAVESDSGGSDIYYDRSDPANVTTVAGADYGQAGSADDLSRSNLYFTGTNMPTTGFTTAQINDFNRRLNTEIGDKNWKGANDIMFDIAWAMGKNFYGSPTDDQGGYGQGNKFIGMLQSDMFSLTDPDSSMWGEDYINSDNDSYTLRDLSGNPRGGTIRFGDAGSYIDNSSVSGGNTIGLQDWSRFGTNPAAPPPLQEGLLKNYQLYAGAPTGTGVNLIGGGGSNNIWGNTLGNGSIVNTATSGANSSTSSTHTDTSGNKWVMTPSGNWVSANSDYGKGLLGTGRLHGDPNFYDSSGAYVGAEGQQGDGTNSPGFTQQEISTGIAHNYGGKWGNRQVGLNLLGKMGILGDNFGTESQDAYAEAAVKAMSEGGKESGVHSGAGKELM